VALERRREGHGDPVDEHLALVGNGEAGYARQRRGLARARRPEQRKELARSCGQRDAVDRARGTEGLDEPLDADLGSPRRGSTTSWQSDWYPPGDRASASTPRRPRRPAAATGGTAPR